MSLTTDDFAELVTGDPADDEDVPLDDALREMGGDVETDALEDVRDVRERI